MEEITMRSQRFDLVEIKDGYRSKSITQKNERKTNYLPPKWPTVAGLINKRHNQIKNRKR